MIVSFGEFINQFATAFSPFGRCSSFVNKKSLFITGKKFIKQSVLIAIAIPVSKSKLHAMQFAQKKGVVLHFFATHNTCCLKPELCCRRGGCQQVIGVGAAKSNQMRFV